MNALDYILKANLYGLLFVGCYWLLLRRHTFFMLNRAYLLTSAMLSLILPLASLPARTVETNWPVPVGVMALPVVAAAPIETGPNWEQITLLAYGFVALVLLLRLVIRIVRLFRFIQQSPRQVFTDYVLVHAPESAGSVATTPTFSFFRYLVLSPADTQNELIIRHELVHIRQGHSADVLALALLRAVFWTSPGLWLIDRMLRQVHEFLADKQASQPTVYARFLIEYAFGAKTDTLTNGFFNPSLLKQRILMLHQQATNRWALGKYLLVLPLAFGLLAMTTAREELMQVKAPFVPSDTSIPTETQPDSQTGRIGKVFTVVEVLPEFPGGMRALGDYINKNLRYPAEARKKKVEGRVFLRFIVTQTGDIQNVQILKGIGSGCDEESVRVVSQMPKWKPGKQAGSPVNVQYNLPIQFTLEKKEDKRTGQVKSTPDPDQKMRGTIDKSKNANYSILGGVKGKPLLLLNGKTEVSSLEDIDPHDIERTEFLMTSKAQVLYGPKAADGVVIIYLKGAWEQDPKVVKQAFLEIIENPAKETEYHIDRKQVTDKEVENLRIENIRAIEWQKGLAPERRFDIVNIYTRQSR